MQPMRAPDVQSQTPVKVADMSIERIIYAYDPLCGWCYGFIPVMRAVAEAHPQVPIDVRMGGLVTGERVAPYSAARGYIVQAAARMGQVTGRPLSDAFFEKILTRDDIISNSAQPCSVVMQVREGSDDPLGRKTLAYAHALQEAHFENAMDINDVATHHAVAERVGVAMDLVMPSREDAQGQMEQEFAAARALGLNSYPTVLKMADKRLSVVPLDYDPAKFLDELATPAQDLRYGMAAGSPDAV